MTRLFWVFVLTLIFVGCTSADGVPSSADVSFPEIQVTPSPLPEENPSQYVPTAEATYVAEPQLTERGTTPATAEISPPTAERAGPPALPNLPILPPSGWAEARVKEAGPSRIGAQRTVALDPGHGGPEPGAAYRWADGSLVVEKDVNLKIALKLRELLERDGFRVVLTRESDERAYYVPSNSASFSATRADLQARVDIANAAGADVFISIHNNASGSSSAASGTEVWYDPNRPFSHLNLALAQEVQRALVAELRAAGHPVVDRGVKDDSHFRVFQGRAFPMFVIGPPRGEPRPTRATQMTGILGETLFVSNPTEASLLRQDYIQDAIARGYRNGIVAYFRLLD